MTTVDGNSQIEFKPRSDLQTFFIKLISVFVAIFLFFVLSVSYLKSELEDSALLRGGPEFWKGFEQGLYKFADGKDIPEEKKAKIIASLRKISAKYGPFVEALHQPSATAK